MIRKNTIFGIRPTSRAAACRQAAAFGDDLYRELQHLVDSTLTFNSEECSLVLRSAILTMLYLELGAVEPNPS